MNHPKVRSTTHLRGRTVKPRAAGLRGTTLGVDAQGGGVLDEVRAVAAVDPGLADGGVLGGDLVEQAGAGDRVLHACGGDGDGQEQAEGVGGDGALAADDLLGRIRALTRGGDVGGGLDALGVDHARRGLGAAAFGGADQAAQQAVQLGEHPLRRARRRSTSTPSARAGSPGAAAATSSRCG
jgi:hypothetical protein